MDYLEKKSEFAIWKWVQDQHNEPHIKDNASFMNNYLKIYTYIYIYIYIYIHISILINLISGITLVIGNLRVK